MSRPGFVLDVDERTPPLLMHQGEGFRLERLPLGAKVISPPDSLPGIRNVDAAIRQAQRVRRGGQAQARESGRAPTTTVLPESWLLSAWAWPWLP